MLLRERIVGVPLALFMEHHHGDAGDRFRHRIDAEDGVALERRARGEVLMAVGVDADKLAVPRDHGHDPRKLLIVDQLPHLAVQPAQPLAEKPTVSGFPAGNPLFCAMTGTNRTNARIAQPVQRMFPPESARSDPQRAGVNDCLVRCQRRFVSDSPKRFEPAMPIVYDS